MSDKEDDEINMNKKYSLFSDDETNVPDDSMQTGGAKKQIKPIFKQINNGNSGLKTNKTLLMLDSDVSDTKYTLRPKPNPNALYDSDDNKAKLGKPIKKHKEYLKFSDHKNTHHLITKRNSLFYNEELQRNTLITNESSSLETKNEICEPVTQSNNFEKDEIKLLVNKLEEITNIDISNGDEINEENVNILIDYIQNLKFEQEKYCEKYKDKKREHKNLKKEFKEFVDKKDAELKNKILINKEDFDFMYQRNISQTVSYKFNKYKLSDQNRVMSKRALSDYVHHLLDISHNVFKSLTTLLEEIHINLIPNLDDENDIISCYAFIAKYVRRNPIEALCQIIKNSIELNDEHLFKLMKKYCKMDTLYLCMNDIGLFDDLSQLSYKTYPCSTLLYPVIHQSIEAKRTRLFYKLPMNKFNCKKMCHIDEINECPAIRFGFDEILIEMAISQCQGDLITCLNLKLSFSTTLKYGITNNLSLRPLEFVISVGSDFHDLFNANTSIKDKIMKGSLLGFFVNDPNVYIINKNALIKNYINYIMNYNSPSVEKLINFGFVNQVFAIRKKQFWFLEWC